MKKPLDSRKIYAAVSLILGILLLLWPGSALRLAAYAAGVLVMGGGILSLTSHFRSGPGRRSTGSGMVLSIFLICIGAWIFLNPENFASIIPSALGALIMLSGIMNLLETFLLSRARYQNWWVSLFAAIMTIFMGMLLINHAFGIASGMVRLGGIFLVFNGISDFWINKRVDEYIHRGDHPSHRKQKRASARGGSRHDTSDPDIVDAKDYREIK